MSFKPFEFIYTPPPTVASPAPTITSVSVASIPGTGIAPTNPTPIASQAIQNLKDLVDTSTYLQSLIVNLYSNTGVAIDPNSDPATGQALSVIYNGVIPPIITTGMYSNLLDCQNALNSINQAVGTDSTVEADPIMLGNVTQVNTAVSSALVSSGGSAQIAIQSLAILKSDSIVMSNIATALGTYATTTDVGPTVAANLKTLINNEASLLSTMNSLLIDANVIQSDVTNVVNAFVLQPIVDIQRIISAVTLFQSMGLKKTVKGIFEGLVTIVDTMLMSELMVSYLAADQIAQRVITPIKSMTGAVGAILTTANSTYKELNTAYNLAKTTLSNTSSPGLPGFYNCNTCSQKVLSGLSGIPGSGAAIGPSSGNLPGFKSLSSGLQWVGQHINAAVSSINKELSVIENGFIALQKRRNKAFADIQQIMCAMQAAESLLSICNQVVNLIQNGPSSSGSGVIPTISGPAPTAITSIANQVLAGSPSSTASPTSIAIPANVAPILTSGLITPLPGVI
jgi:hypothetical protein